MDDNETGNTLDAGEVLVEPRSTPQADSSRNRKSLWEVLALSSAYHGSQALRPPPPATQVLPLLKETEAPALREGDPGRQPRVRFNPEATQ